MQQHDTSARGIAYHTARTPPATQHTTSTQHDRNSNNNNNINNAKQQHGEEGKSTYAL